MKVWMTLALMFLFGASAALASDNLKAFSPAQEGMVRYVLQLAKQTDESVFKVELVVGKTVQVDTQNRYFFGGQIVRETIPGWGFTRYIARRLGRGQARSGPSIRTRRKWSGLSHLVATPTLSATIVVCPS